jgi:hypothetical protein
MRSRVLALVAAAAMVAVAVQVRAGLDEREAEGRPRIVCATELALVCDALDGDADVQVEAAGVTADRLVGGGDDFGLDGWVTPGPWPALVRTARTRLGKQPGLHVFGRPLARTRLALASWPEATEPVRKACGAALTWDCLVAAAGSPAFKLGLPDPRRDGLGLVALAGAAQALAPEAPLEDDRFRGELDALARAVPRPLPPFRTVLAGGPALADVYVTVEAGAGNRMRLAYPSPVVAVDVMVGDVRGGRGERADALLRGGRVRDVLVEAGWRTDVEGASGLPAPDVLHALRAMWMEVAG